MKITRSLTPERLLELVEHSQKAPKKELRQAVKKVTAMIHQPILKTLYWKLLPDGTWRLRNTPGVRRRRWEVEARKDLSRGGDGLL